MVDGGRGFLINLSLGFDAKNAIKFGQNRLSGYIQLYEKNKIKKTIIFELKNNFNFRQKIRFSRYNCVNIAIVAMKWKREESEKLKIFR